MCGSTRIIRRRWETREGKLRRLGQLAAVTLFVTAFSISNAQDALNVTEADLMSHVERRVPLVYPAIATVARVSGTVVVQVDVSIDGVVTGTKVVSGPPMLLQAALDSVKQWTFKPFEEDGEKVVVNGPISLIFTLGESIVGSGPRSSPTADSMTQTVEVRAEGVPVDAEE